MQDSRATATATTDDPHPPTLSPTGMATTHHRTAQALVDDPPVDSFADSPLDHFPEQLEQHEQPPSFVQTTGTSPPSDLRGIVTMLRQSGFRNMDEVYSAIRTVQQQQQQSSEPPIELTVETVLCALIQAREDAQLARDTDEARRLSELEYEQEVQRMKETEKLDLHEQLLRDWSLDDLLRPCSSATNIGGFDRSWLLKHADLQSTLETIMIQKKHHHQNDKDTLPKDNDTDDSTHVNINNKRLLLRLLKLEKNARKWYSTGIPKWYFTLELANRLVPLLTRPVSTDAMDTAESSITPSQTHDCVMERIQVELETICTEVEEGHSLMAKQDKNQIPWIYVHAHGKYAPTRSMCTSSTLPTSTLNSTNAYDREIDAHHDGDDDDIIVLDEEEVRQLTGRTSDPSETMSAKEIMVDP